MQQQRNHGKSRRQNKEEITFFPMRLYLNFFKYHSLLHTYICGIYTFFFPRLLGMVFEFSFSANKKTEVRGMKNNLCRKEIRQSLHFGSKMLFASINAIVISFIVWCRCCIEVLIAFLFLVCVTWFGTKYFFCLFFLTKFRKYLIKSILNISSYFFVFFFSCYCCLQWMVFVFIFAFFLVLFAFLLITLRTRGYIIAAMRF